MTNLMKIPGYVASARQAGGGGAPAGAHRYWRVVVETVDSGSNQTTNPWRLAQIDLWRYEYLGSVLTSEATISSASAANESSGGTANLLDGAVPKIVTGESYETSGEVSAPYQITVDLGEGNEDVVGVVLLYDASTSHGLGGYVAASGRIQYSDNGSDFTDAWTFSGLTHDDDYSPSYTPLKLVSPDVEAMPAVTNYPTLRYIDYEYILDPLQATYSDDGITPISNGQGVYRVDNPATHNARPNFTQTTEANRPIYRTGGMNGHPYFDGAGDLYFENVPWEIAAGTGVLPSQTLIAVTDNIPDSGFPGMLGDPDASLGGKVSLYFRPGDPGDELHPMDDGWRNFTIEDSGGQGHIWGAHNVDDDDIFLIRDEELMSASQGSALVSTEVDETCIMRRDESGSNNFNGDLYFLMLASGFSPVEFNTIHNYLLYRTGMVS